MAICRSQVPCAYLGLLNDKDSKNLNKVYDKFTVNVPDTS